jgi:hypothetical protein
MGLFDLRQFHLISPHGGRWYREQAEKRLDSRQIAAGGTIANC